MTGFMGRLVDFLWYFVVIELGFCVDFCLNLAFLNDKLQILNSLWIYFKSNALDASGTI